MTKQEYQDIFRTELLKQFPEAHVEPMEVEKFDGMKTGLGIHFPELKIAPVIYPDQYRALVDRGEETVQSVVEKVALQMREFMEERGHQTVEDLRDPERLRLVTLPKNTSEETLSDIPHMAVSGTDVVCGVRYMLHGNRDSEQSYLVKNEHLQMFKLTRDEVLEKAMQNTRTKTEFVVETLGQRLGAMLTAEGDIYMMDRTEPALYVITSSDMRRGAVALALPEVLEHAREKMGAEEIFILPSSTEELLAIEKGILQHTSVEDLRDMVRTINSTEVSPEIQLSDEVFYYDGQALQIATPELEESLQAAQSLGESVEEIMSETDDAVLEENEKLGRSR